VKIGLNNRLGKLETVRRKGQSLDNILPHFSDADLRDCIECLEAGDAETEARLIARNPSLRDRLLELSDLANAMTPAEQDALLSKWNLVTEADALNDPT
jgi:hypothetical protein